MCTGIIGHCHCLRCVDHLSPGKLLRIEFCQAQQDELVGVCTPSRPRQRELVPCNNLVFERVREPEACQFKSDNMEKGSVEDNHDDDDDATSKQPSSKAAIDGPSGSGISFTPINAASVANKLQANASRSARAKDGSNKTKDQGQSYTVGDGKQPKTDTDTGARITPTDGNDKDGGMDIGKETSTSTDLTPATVRTRLPDIRPRNPLVAEATAAPAAARVAKGEWAHYETVKLLLLRSKAVGFEEMGRFLPGRDPESCAVRLAGLAEKYGYAEYM